MNPTTGADEEQARKHQCRRVSGKVIAVDVGALDVALGELAVQEQRPQEPQADLARHYSSWYPSSHGSFYCQSYPFLFR